jgi:hypothetical protein
MKDIKLYNDFLSLDKKNKLEEILLSQDFPWFLIKKSSGPTEKVFGYNDTVQFEHHFLKDGIQSSSALPMIYEMMDLYHIVNHLNLPNKVLRIKSNLLLKTQKTPNTPHVDMNLEHLVLLYYVNDSDGPTVFYEKKNNNFKVIKKINPSKGSFVVFDGDIYHSSTPPQKNNYRCVVNINLKN